MSKFRFIIVLIATLAGIASAHTIDIDVPETIPDDPINVRADRLEFANDTIIASGNVTGLFERVTLSADQLTGNKNTGDLHVEGNIHFERDNVIWKSTVLDYNIFDQTGEFGASTLEMDPVLIAVGGVECVSNNEYLLHNATFTTCS